MFKRILTALLVAGTVFMIASCDKQPADTPDDVKPPINDVTNTEDPDTTPSDDSDEIDYEADLSKERYDGYNYRIQVRAGQAGTQYFEEPQEDLVDDAIYRRNQAVEEKYGVTLSVHEAAGSYQTEALNSILAGDDAYDIIFAHSRAAFTYAIQGAAYNIHDIETIHLEKPWWRQNMVDSCTVGGNLYVLDGDIDVMGLSCSMCMMFNKTLFDELGFDYPYELVEDGDWTFDEFAYYVKKGSSDLNGDGILKAEDDQFGFVASGWGAPINALYAGGQKIYGKNEEGYLELSLYSNKTAAIFDEFFRLMDNEACYLYDYTGGPEFNGSGLFQQGRALMSDALLLNAKDYRNMDDDFGIIPFPKFDTDDEYATTINGVAPLAIIPITVSDVNRTGAITEALCAYGSREVIPAFYEVSLKGKYSRDEQSEDMLDIIKGSLVYDIGYVAGGPFQSIGRDLLSLTTHDFASFYAARAESAQSNLENFNRDYGGLE